MSKETMKLALEALEYIYEGANNQGPHTGISWRCVSKKAAPVIIALQKALAKPDFWEGYVPEPVKPAQQALDKKAENARELGLDYEPAQQEPVAWLHTKIEGVAVSHRPADLNKHPDRWEALYKTPPPCPTCEALARTVMMDQTGRDA
jgi:hypothetical protein